MHFCVLAPTTIAPLFGKSMLISCDFQIDVFYYYYPKRLGQVLFVDAPFVFQPLWQLVKPLLKQYASLVSTVFRNILDEMILHLILSTCAVFSSAYKVRFCDAETVRKEYFTEETVPPDFRS
jgi:hypothetical protein